MRGKFFKAVAITVTALFIFATGCSKEDSGGGSVPTAPDVVNNAGGNDSGTGVSSNDDITVSEGRIEIKVENGKIELSGENVTLITKNEDGTWSLIDGISITAKDEDGNDVAGTIHVDETTGTIYFVPSAGLDTGKTYTIIVVVNGKTYKETIILSVDDTCKSNSMFAPVQLRSAGTYTVKQLISNGKAIFGWNFGSAFRIRMQNLEAGAKVMLTAFGVYDIPGHECEVYYQRWKTTQKPVEDFEWSGFTIRVDETDSSIDSDKNDFSFTKTYFVLKVVKDGEDITATTNAKVVVY